MQGTVIIWIIMASGPGLIQLTYTDAVSDGFAATGTTGMLQNHHLLTGGPPVGRMGRTMVQ